MNIQPVSGSLPKMSEKGQRRGLKVVTALLAGGGAITVTALGATALMCNASPLVFDYTSCREISIGAIRAAVQIIQANPVIAAAIDVGLTSTAALSAIAARAPKSGKSKKRGRR